MTLWCGFLKQSFGCVDQCRSELLGCIWLASNGRNRSGQRLQNSGGPHILPKRLRVEVWSLTNANGTNYFALSNIAQSDMVLWG
jgi:hypothetical protein